MASCVSGWCEDVVKWPNRRVFRAALETEGEAFTLFSDLCLIWNVVFKQRPILKNSLYTDSICCILFYVQRTRLCRALFLLFVCAHAVRRHLDESWYWMLLHIFFLLLSLLLCSILMYVWDCFNGTWKTCWMLLYFCYLIYYKLRLFFSLYGNKVMKPVKIRLWSQRQRQHSLTDLILCVLCVLNFRVPPPTACVFVLYASSCTANDRHFYQSQQGGQCWLANVRGINRVG